jgi:hypothetical protein
VTLVFADPGGRASRPRQAARCGAAEIGWDLHPVESFGYAPKEHTPMSMTETTDEQQPTEPPRGHVRMVYLGPVAPHWEVESEFGDRPIIEEFRQRALARLVLLPPHDPQFRRNRERIVRDAERENLVLEWDLGVPEEEVVNV